MLRPRDGDKGFKGTGFLDWSRLDVHLYAGANGEFTMVEDDFVTDLFESGQMRKTHFALASEGDKLALKITKDQTSDAQFPGKVDQRLYRFFLHGVNAACVTVNGKRLTATAERFNDANVPVVTTEAMPVSEAVALELCGA
jgi:hypothetical protein